MLMHLSMYGRDCPLEKCDIFTVSLRVVLICASLNAND